MDTTLASKMEDSEAKRRTISSTSSSSSVTEYVNEMFQDSELVLKDESLSVSIDSQTVEKPSAEFSGDMKHQAKRLQDFSDVQHSDQNSSEFIPRGFRKMYLAALVVLLFAVCMGITVTYSATATTDMAKPHSSIHPTDDDVTWIGSLMPIGALIGGTAGGYFTSSLGRKGALMFNTVPFVLGWLLVAHATSIRVIFAGRILTGFSCGIVSVTTPMYLVEISTPEIRGLLGASFQLFVVIGVLIVASLGAGLTWRWLAVSGAIMSLLAAFLMLPMPESPRWLIAQRRRGEAKNAITFLQGESYDADGELEVLEEEIKKQPTGGVSFRELIAPTIYKPFLLSIALMFFQQFSGVNAVMFYTVDIFKSAKVSLDPILATIIVSFVQVLATLASSILMDRAGRRPLLLISGAWMAFSLIVFGGYNLGQSKDSSVADNYGWLPVVCLTSFIAAFSIGFGPTPWLMVAEMTPVRVRSLVSGVSTALNWTFAFIITKSYKALESGIKGYGVYWFYGMFCIVSILFTYFLLPETKGKKMSEIEEYFIRKKSVTSNA